MNFVEETDVRRNGLKAAPAWIAGIMAGLCAGSALAANPSDRVFTVANYPVDARAKDAVAAKEKAHADGQQAALGALLKRLVPVTAYNRIARLKKVNAASIMDGVAVRSEATRRPSTSPASTSRSSPTLSAICCGTRACRLSMCKRRRLCSCR